MKIHTSEPYIGYTPDITDEAAREVAADKLGVAVERIELLSTKGAVLCREMEDDQGTGFGEGAG